MTAKRKRYGAEEIIANLREADVGLAQGQSVGQVARRLGVSEHAYYRWRREYGGMKELKCKLSPRDMAEMLLQRGFTVTHETIRAWEFRFAPIVAKQLRARRRGRRSLSWSWTRCM